MPDWSKQPSVEGRLTFIGGEVDGPAEFRAAPEHPPEHLPYVDRMVSIHDASGVADQLSLDREGVILADLDDSRPDYDDPEELRRIWVPAVQAMLKRETGASHVFSWAIGRRYSTSLPQSQRRGETAAARMVHSDFAPGAVGMTVDNRPVAEVIADMVGDARPRRWRAYNVWQATSPPPHDMPLAFCDCSSARAEDFVTARGRSTYENGQAFDFEVSWVKYAQRQSWLYFRDLRPDQAIIFCGLDLEVGAMAHRVAHTAFRHPDVPADAPPRASVEIRNIVVWG